jgi:hypothetical protein
MKGRFILYLLVALLAVFVVQGVFFGIFMFVMVLKYVIIASVIAGVFYIVSHKKKQ